MPKSDIILSAAADYGTWVTWGCGSKGGWCVCHMQLIREGGKRRTDWSSWMCTDKNYLLLPKIMLSLQLQLWPSWYGRPNPEDRIIKFGPLGRSYGHTNSVLRFLFIRLSGFGLMYPTRCDRSSHEEHERSK